MALDMLAAVASEYLLNVGRKIWFLFNKFGETMTPEVGTMVSYVNLDADIGGIENNITYAIQEWFSKVQDLEWYIFDNIECYGLRLGKLEKKIVGAYQETVCSFLQNQFCLKIHIFSGCWWGPGGWRSIWKGRGRWNGRFSHVRWLYPLLSRGWLANWLCFAQWWVCWHSWRGLSGTTSVGYRSQVWAIESQHSEEVAQEEKRTKQANNVSLFLISHDIYVVTAFHSEKPLEPPLPYPPPVLFVPLRESDINYQIGLLKLYYHNQIALLITSSAPPIAVAPAPLPSSALGPSLTSLNPSVPPPPLPSHMILPSIHSNMLNPLANPPALATPPPDLILPDDSPNPSQLKMTPIGQIVKSSGAGGGMKKQSKVVADGSTGGNVVAGAAAAAAGSSALPVAVGMSDMCLAVSGAQKKGAMGVGNGNGWKKNAPPLLPLPVPMAIRYLIMISFLCSSPSSPPLRHVPYIVYKIHDLCCDQPWINHHNGHTCIDHHLDMSIHHQNEEDRDEEDRDKWDRPETRSWALVGFFFFFFSWIY
jgi:transcriptional activator SPT7